MPVEIKEIIVRAEVRDIVEEGTHGLREEDVELIVERCVEEVMRMIKEMKER